MQALSSGEINDLAFGIYRKNGADLLRLVAVPATCAYGLFAIAWHLVGRSLTTTANPDSVWSQAGELILVLAVGVLAAAPLVLIAYAYMSGATSLYVSDVTLGRAPHSASIHRRVMSRLPQLTLLVLLVVLRSVSGLLIGFGLLLLSALADSQVGSGAVWLPIVSLLGVVGIVSGVVFFFVFVTRDLLAPVVMLQEGASPIASIRRSKMLSQSGGPGVFGLLLITLVLQLLLWSSLQIPASLLQDYLLTQGVASGNLALKVLYSILSSFGAYASFLLVHPVFIAGVTVVYFDRRVRSEGLDIELLAQDIWKRSRAVDFEL